MKQTFIFLSLVLTMILSGCSKAPGKSDAKFKISIAAISSGVSSGGAMLWGRSDRGDMFGAVVTPALALDMNLPNAKWTFWSVAWEGNGTGNFTGKTRCGKTSAALVGSDIQVNLTLSNNNCDLPDFSPGASVSGGEKFFPKTTVFDCQKLSDHNGVGCGAIQRSKTTGRRLVLHSFNKPKDAPVQLLPARIVSACKSNGNDFVDERLPLGDGFVPIFTTLESFYSSSNCDESDPKGMRIANYDFGLAGTARLDTIKFLNEGTCAPASIPMQTCHALGGAYAGTCTMTSSLQKQISQAACTANGGTYNTDPAVRSFQLITAVPDFEICMGPRVAAGNITPHTFASGDGSISAPFTICTETQLNRISSNYPTSHFSLQSDLNMNRTSVLGDQSPPPCTASDPGANFHPIGGHYNGDCSVESAATTFSGSFDGNDHVVANIRLRGKGDQFGFSRYGGDFSNLTLQNIEIEGSNQVGALVGAYSGNIKNVRIEGARVRGRGQVGGVVGRVSSMNEFYNIQVKGAELELDSGSANPYIGGFVGHNDAPSMYIRNSSFQGLIKSNTDAENAGGFLGYGQSGINVYVYDSFTSGVILVSGVSGSYAGGFAGNVTGPLNTYDSYSKMNISARMYKDTWGSAMYGGLVGASSGGSLNYTYYQGGVTHPCKDTSNSYCIVRSLMGSNSSPSGTAFHGSVTTRNWYSADPDNHTNEATFENGAIKTALISNTKFKEVGTPLPRLIWESGPCALASNNASVATQAGIGRGGSVLNPVVICHKDQWKSMVSYPGLHYVLEDDISLGDITQADAADFTGTLNGKGHIVSGFHSVVSVGAGGLFKTNAGKIHNITFAGGYMLPGGTSTYVGIVGNNLAAGIIEDVNVESVNLVSSISSHQAGVLSGFNQGSIKQTSVDGYLVSSGGNIGLAIGVNSGDVGIMSARGFLKATASGGTIYVGGVTGDNTSSGTMSEVESDVRIKNFTNSDSNSRFGGLAGKSQGTIRDALILPRSRMENTVGGPLYGQVIGLATATSVTERVLAPNEIFAFSGSATGLRQFIAEDLSNASTGVLNSYGLNQAVLELSPTPQSTNTCDDTTAGYFTYTTNSIFNNDPSFADGYFMPDLNSDLVSGRISGVHSDGTNSILATIGTDWTMACGNSGFVAGKNLYAVNTLAGFSHGGFSVLSANDFADIISFCPGASSATGNLNYQCSSPGYLDIVEDGPGGIGFNRMVEVYRSMINKTALPANRPIWSLEAGKYPKLIMTH